MAKEGRIFRSKTTENFTVLKNEILDRIDLSWASKGLLAYLLRLPPDWKVYKSEVQKRALDGRHSFETAWNELLGAGYIVGGDQAKDKGKFGGKDFVIFDVPQGVTDAGNQQRFVSEISNGADAGNQQLLKTNTSKKENKWGELILQFFNQERFRFGFKGPILITPQRIKVVERLMKDYKFTDEDFKKVIRHRFEKWKDDPRMRDYLTPETIFRPANFPKYLEEVNALPEADWTSKRMTVTDVELSKKAWPA